jgi:hypothetical protein
VHGHGWGGDGKRCSNRAHHVLLPLRRTGEASQLPPSPGELDESEVGLALLREGQVEFDCVALGDGASN